MVFLADPLWRTWGLVLLDLCLDIHILRRQGSPGRASRRKSHTTTESSQFSGDWKILACGQRYLCMMMYADEIWIWICSECSLQRYLPQNKRKTAASPRDFLPPAPAHRPGKCGYVHPEDQLGSASQATHEPCGGVQLSLKDSENAASHNLSIFSLEEMQSR